MNCEIEFLPVGESSKPGDAIIVRYGSTNSYDLMIVDGGNINSGKALVQHVRNTFGENSVISHVVLTHSDADHASGLREVLSELPVRNLWLHIPWLSAAAARPYFENKNWTEDGLSQAILKEYDLVTDILKIASATKTIKIYQPFTGASIGPFRVLSPNEAIYPLLLPQFERTPDPDQAAIEAAGFWIGKPPSLLAKAYDKVAAKVQKWVTETWDTERLKDGGVTSASNESSVVLYGDFGEGRRVLLTSDAGVRGLTMAADYADQSGLPLRDFMFVQIPHHGSRRNVGPSILSRVLGPIQPQNNATRFSAFVSAPRDDDTHPRKMVLNAFMRRGGTVGSTQSKKIRFPGGFPPRPTYESLQALPFTPQVEDYE